MASDEADLDAAYRWLERARRRNHAQEIGKACAHVAFYLVGRDEHAEAKRYVDEAPSRLGNPSDAEFPCFVLSIAGGVYWQLGDLSRAAQLYELSATQEVAHGHSDGVRSAKANLGCVLQDLGRGDEAEQLWAEVLVTPSDSGEGLALTEMASYFLASRLHERADHEIVAALLLNMSCKAFAGDYRTHAADMLVAAEEAAADDGRFADARERVAHGLEYMDRPADAGRRVLALEQMGAACLMLGDLDGAEVALRQALDTNGTEAERNQGILARIQRQLGDVIAMRRRTRG